MGKCLFGPGVVCPGLDLPGLQSVGIHQAASIVWMRSDQRRQTKQTATENESGATADTRSHREVADTFTHEGTPVEFKAGQTPLRFDWLGFFVAQKKKKDGGLALYKWMGYWRDLAYFENDSNSHPGINKPIRKTLLATKTWHIMWVSFNGLYRHDMDWF